MKVLIIRRVQLSGKQSIAVHLPAVAALVFLAVLSSGCNQILGLDKTTELKSDAYICSCRCTTAGGFLRVSEAVCLPDFLNPNKNKLNTLTQFDLDNDCEGRVENNINEIGRQCVSDLLNCLCVAAPISTMFIAGECEAGCTAEDLDPSCSNFDTHSIPPVKTATNVPGQEPVCLIASSDPPNPVPDPLVAEIGRASYRERV